MVDMSSSIKETDRQRLQSSVQSSSNKLWLWTAITDYAAGILAIKVGDRNDQTFAQLTAEN